MSHGAACHAISTTSPAATRIASTIVSALVFLRCSPVAVDSSRLGRGGGIDGRVGRPAGECGISARVGMS